MTLEIVTGLRRALHVIPEVSGREEKTKALLQSFLQEHTSLRLYSCGEGFYAAHRESAPDRPALALRADYDAVAVPGGGAGHLCGHDGHAAALCGAAMLAEGKRFGRDIFFLFQPAEETGQGAGACVELFEKEAVGEIYGAHNLPGLPLGQVFTRPGSMACASQGVILYFRGSPAHAAYPENGVSPARAVGRLLCGLDRLAAPERYSGMTLCTVIGVRMGEQAFGMSASDGEVWLTLRGEYEKDLAALYDGILRLAQELAKEEGLGFYHAVRDVFPSTENTPVCAQKVLELCGGQLLAEPMRWSEDFGHYLKVCPGAFFGIGAGVGHPALHTEGYEYPDELLEPAMKAFLALMQG